MTNKLRTILLVDDDDDCNAFVKILCTKEGVAENVDVAHNGIEALEYLKTHSPLPELILLDINMPGMNGWEFLREYPALQARMKERIPVVVMVTVSTNPDDMKQAQEQGVQFINKPLTKDALKTIVQQLS